MGDWFEIGRYPNPWQKDYVAVKTNYRLRKDGKIDFIFGEGGLEASCVGGMSGVQVLVLAGADVRADQTQEPGCARSKSSCVWR